MLRVLHVISPAGDNLGADSWVHAEIVKALDRDDHEVFVALVPATAAGPTPFYEAVGDLDDVTFINLAPGPRGPIGRNPVDVVRSVAAGAAAMWSMIRLIWLVWRYRIDVIHTSDRPRDALVSVMLGRLSRAHVVVHVHVLFRDWMSTKLQWAIRHADHRIAVSEFVRQSLLDGGMAAESTHVALNAIDIGRWTPGVKRDVARSEFGYDESSRVIVSVCRLFAEKGPADLIRAVDRVRRDVPGVRLMIVGADHQPGKPYLAVLRSLVDELGLQEHVIFTGRRSDVPALMASAEVFAMPSFEEPFGLVFGEAMAMGLPVVALNNGGTVEVVGHGEHGLLSDPGDSDALVDNLTALLVDDALRERLGTAGRQRVEQFFTVDRMAADVASIYRRISS